VLLEYGDGRMGLLIVRGDIAYTFRATILGSRSSAHVAVEDSAGFFREMLVRFIGMVRTGAMPIPPADTLEIIRILAAVRQSRATGQEVRL
jgi:predicted dehydrogenase